MKHIKRLLALFMVAAVLATVAACGPTKDPSGDPQSEPNSPAQSQSSDPESKQEDETQYRNLCEDFLKGYPELVPTDMWTMYDWDLENKFIECSKSLECAWGTGGYGKSFLFDGTKGSHELLYDEGIYVSCTVKPGWGAYEGEIYPESVTWKKKDLNETMKIDLQGVHKIDKVVLCSIYAASDHGFPAAFTISVSKDGTTWTDVHEETNYLTDITTLDQVFSFDEVEARYVKLHFTKGTKSIDNNLAYCVALSELEIWGK